MRESMIEKSVTQYAQSKGALSFKVLSVNQRGLPDRAYLYKGETVYIEYKATGRQPTAMQLKVHRDFLDVGVQVHVVNSIKQGLELIDALFPA